MGRPEDENADIADYVLSPFTRDEQARFPDLFLRIKDDLEGMLK